MISHQYSHPYIQIISPHMREAHAALDAILHHETELPIREMMVDTAGFTELMYALYDLQGLKLSPRIRDLADQRLYPVEGVSEYGVLKPLFRGQAIQRDLIVRCGLLGRTSICVCFTNSSSCAERCRVHLSLHCKSPSFSVYEANILPLLYHARK